MLKRPKLSKREDSAGVPAGGGSSGGSGSGTGITTHDLAAALAGSYAAPSAGGVSSGITTADLGPALSGGGGASGNRSVYSTRHTSYPQPGDLTGLPARAGTRTGPRTTSYRIPLQRGAQSNVYDTVN